MQSLKKVFSSTIKLFYPHVCVGCGSDVLHDKDLICYRCVQLLPHTQFEKFSTNPIDKIFYGRVPIEAAYSEFYFSKGQLIQTLIHEFKYKANKDIGLYLSKLMGQKMIDNNRFNNIDYVIPLPLFADKEFKRGFNQAEIICNGLSKIMNIPVLTKNVIRVHFTETQTKKHRSERWENVAKSFLSTNPLILQNKHLLLVDDVITTGATLEACAQILHQIQGCKISIAALTNASK